MQRFVKFIHPAGWPFIGVFAAITFLLHYTNGYLFALGLVLTAWCVYFFRDPTRVTPTRSGLIISPADGKVVAIQQVKPDPDLGLSDALYTRISIFLNVFDVHMNRMPADGIVRFRKYRPGKFVNAALDKASVDNERMALTLEMTNNKIIGVVQIAGLIARRIVCNAKEGDHFKAGEHFGLIRFGSRTDVYLPLGIEPQVIVGQYMLGGETVLADYSSGEAARIGEAR